MEVLLLEDFKAPNFSCEINSDPTIILLTENCKSESADQSARYLEELQLSLQSAGACKVSFNPITNNTPLRRLSPGYANWSSVTLLLNRLI
ncbi:hypothetical protein M5689_014151 [Euphorbia peplus]|nr:hypothetical protein M5689_014151 [Euphorbia peplus]